MKKLRKKRRRCSRRRKGVINEQTRKKSVHSLREQKTKAMERNVIQEKHLKLSQKKENEKRWKKRTEKRVNIFSFNKFILRIYDYLYLLLLLLLLLFT